MLASLPAALALACAVASPSFSHSDGDQTYDPWCCNTRDCAPIPASAVTAGPNGWRVTIRPGDHPMARNAVTHFVPYGSERRADDGRHHACLFPTEQTLRCLYVPPQGF
jgi:hypothetical protein